MPVVFLFLFLAGSPANPELQKARDAQNRPKLEQIATQLSSEETQNQALMSVISTLEKQSLFDYTQ